MEGEYARAVPVHVLNAVKLSWSRLVRALPALVRKESNVKKNRSKKEQPGDVLGISNPGGPKLAHPPSDGTTPRGIEVRGDAKRHWGNEDIPQSDGASGVDMGGAGEGTGITPENSSRRRGARSRRQLRVAPGTPRARDCLAQAEPPPCRRARYGGGSACRPRCRTRA